MQSKAIFWLDSPEGTAITFEDDSISIEAGEPDSPRTLQFVIEPALFPMLRAALDAAEGK